MQKSRAPAAFRALVLATAALGEAACFRAPAAPPMQPAAPVPAQPRPAEPADGILAIEPTNEPSAVFMHQGKPFCFAGTNNYYLTYQDRAMVDDIFVQAKALGAKVIRTWAFIDRGSLDDSVPSTDRNQWEPFGTKKGVYFQYWDTSTKSVAYNEGTEKNDGLVRLDYVLSKAAEHDIKLVLVLTNNWKEFGGMDQYLRWFNLSFHHEFYTDERAKAAYKEYAAHLANRVNTITGVAYKDDPSIFAWELANEPRCRNYGQFDRLEDCNADVITSWAREMSAHLKALAPQHLVAVGDEGFFNRPGSPTEQYNGKDGADHEAFLAIDSVDFGTFHLYPDNWSTTTSWGNQWILDHIEAAQRASKPTVLEEYGVAVQRDEKTGQVTGGLERRRTAYTNWNNLIRLRGGNAAMFWLLAGIDPSNEATGHYPDYDHYSVYNLPHDATAKLVTQFAGELSSSARACELASANAVELAPSPFVSVARPARPSARAASGVLHIARLEP